MCCKIFWKRIIPFAVALAIGLLAANILHLNNAPINNAPNESQKDIKPVEKLVVRDKGTGFCRGGTGRSNFLDSISKFPFPKNSSETQGLKITSKLQPEYPDAARLNNVQGSVTLRVTFLANGAIGGVQPITELPYGLTEECIKAAKQIKFESAKRNGQPVSVTKQVQYNFTIY